MFKKLLNEKGISIVLMALSIIVLFAFGAIAIDIGHLYSVKDQLQVAADAAALAGAAAIDGTDLTVTQTAARDAAQGMALKNTADVAAQDIPTTSIKAGETIPVYLARNAGNTDAGDTNDIVVGNWDSTLTPPFLSTRTPINAVKVIAKRTGNAPTQPEAQNWFAKIFHLMGASYDLSKISAIAVAAKVEGGKLLPIAVNEYWQEEIGAGNRAYGNKQDYPNSFTRQTNVNGSNSQVAGYTFAILGSQANDNVPSSASKGSNNVNGFLNLDFRNNYHYGSTSVTTGSGKNKVTTTTAADWYQLTDLNNNQTCANYCNAEPAVTAPSQGSITNSTQQNTGTMFMFNGYSRVPPTAINEPYRASYPNTPLCAAPGGYPCKPSSPCPRATVAFFPGGGSGTDPLNYNGQNFVDVYKPGDRFVATVYDGTFVPVDPSYPGTVSVIGFVLVEIDGYSSDQPKNIGLSGGNSDPIYAANKAALLKAKKNNTTSEILKGNTLYGHIVPHGLTGLTGTVDPYILQRSNVASDCDLISKLDDLKKKASNPMVHLVDPNLQYGMASH